MSDLQIPILEINQHPDNHRVHWHVNLPPIADPGNITANVGAIDRIADAGHLGHVYVLPDDPVRLGALAHSGFDTGIEYSSTALIDDALTSPGRAFRIFAEDTSIMHVGLKLGVHEQLQALREEGLVSRSDLWAEFFDGEIKKSLGRAAIANLFDEFTSRFPRIGSPLLGALRLGVSKAVTQNYAGLANVTAQD